MTTYTDTIETAITLDLASVWEDAVGNYFGESAYWQEYLTDIDLITVGHKWRKSEWDASNRAKFTFTLEQLIDISLVPEAGSTLVRQITAKNNGFVNEVGDLWVKYLTAEDFAKARIQLVKENWSHCGEYPVDAVQTEFGFENDDACVSDAIVQYALFGKFIFG